MESNIKQVVLHIKEAHTTFDVSMVLQAFMQEDKVEPVVVPRAPHTERPNEDLVQIPDEVQENEAEKQMEVIREGEAADVIHMTRSQISSSRLLGGEIMR